jgi:hypothetical protein
MLPGVWIAQQLMVRVIKRGIPVNVIFEEQLMSEKQIKVRVIDR